MRGGVCKGLSSIDEWREKRLDDKNAGYARKLNQNNNPLDFIQRDFIARSVVKFCRSRRLVRGDGLRFLDRSAILQVSRDSGGPESVAACADGKPDAACPPFDHAKHVVGVHSALRDDPARLAVECSEQGRVAIASDCRRVKIRVEICLGIMVRRNLVMLSTFLMKSQPPALPILPVVFDVHLHDGANTGERIDHNSDQRAVAKANQSCCVDAVEKFARLLRGEHRGLPVLHNMLGTANRPSRIDAERAARNQPVQADANRG